ncbi:hypothetical protein ACYSUO_39515 [Streptomyces sp. UC4497]
MDFIETVTLTGQRQYILAAIHHSSRRVHVLGHTARPTHAWVTRAIRNLVMDRHCPGPAPLRAHAATVPPCSGEKGDRLQLPQVDCALTLKRIHILVSIERLGRILLEYQHAARTTRMEFSAGTLFPGAARPGRSDDAAALRLDERSSAFV